MVRQILHLDLDAFFCAVEELRDPNLRNHPFAVGGKPEERGVVSSCSYSARKYGIRSAMPMAHAIRLCPRLIIVQGHYRDYSKASREVMERLRQITDHVEQVSIDEAFLDISELSEPGEIIAQRIQQEINDELHLPCSIGIATNKLVAKIATEVGKATAKKESPPNAIQVVPPGSEEQFLAPLPVELLWGVGPKTAARLSEFGIQTIGELAARSENELISHFGKFGYELVKRSKGIDDHLISTTHILKSVSQETTFAKDVTQFVPIAKTLESLSKQVSERLIRKNHQGTVVKLKLRWADFSTITRQKKLPQPTDQFEVIYRTGRQLFETIWTPGKAVRLVGIGITGFSKYNKQLSLWDSPNEKETIDRNHRLHTAVETLRHQFGEKIIHWGVSNFENEAEKD